MRKKREMFYLHDDYHESEIEYSYNGVDFIIMVANGDISKKEFKAFWSRYASIDDFGKYIKEHYRY